MLLREKQRQVYLHPVNDSSSLNRSTNCGKREVEVTIRAIFGQLHCSHAHKTRNGNQLRNAVMERKTWRKDERKTIYVAVTLSAIAASNNSWQYFRASKDNLQKISISINFSIFEHATVHSVPSNRQDEGQKI